jgi:anti-sigma factor RsiW
MNHSELQEKLFERHDARLSAGLAAEVDAHLEACLDCRTQLDAWTQTTQTFLSPLRLTDSQVFTQGVMRTIRNLPETQARPRFFARWAFPALALSMGSFAAALLYVTQPTTLSADGLFFADPQTTPSQWITSIAREDHILGPAVEKP